MVGLVLLGGLVIASDFYFDERDALTTVRDNLELEWLLIQDQLDQKELWEMRAHWMDQNQPEFTSADQITQMIYKDSLAEEETGFTTSKQNLLPTEITVYYNQAGVAFVAQGELAPFMRWLYDLTRPESFRVLRNIKITPDKENEEEIIASNIELLRWHTPSGI